MNKYNFEYIKKNDKIMSTFILNNWAVLNQLIKQCFDIDLENNYLWLFQKDIAILKDDNNIIAFSYITKSKFVSNISIDTYKLVIKKKYNLQNTKNIYPVMHALCRSPIKKYKGIGKLFLNKILNHFKVNMNQKKLYIVPESTKFKKLNQNNNDCGITLYKKQYLYSQKELIKYYKAFGFKLINKLYEIDECNDNQIVAFPVFYIDIV